MRRSKTQGGFTLVELMVTMVIAASVWLGVFNLMQTQMRASMLTQDSTELQSNMQAIAEMVRRDILLAGMGVSGMTPIEHVNNAYQTGDLVRIWALAQYGSTINTQVMAGPLGSVGTTLYLRCFGTHGSGGTADMYKDAVQITPFNGTYLYLSFYSPFNGERLTSVTQFNFVNSTNPVAGANCIPNPYGIDTNNDGVADPAVLANMSTTINVPNGTIVYGLRWSGGMSQWYSTYYVDPGTKTLRNQNVELMTGVENFQVRYHVKGQPQTTWLDVLTGVDTTQIDGVRVSIVARSARPEPNGVLDPRTSLVNYDQTFTLSAADRRYTRQAHEFFVRPVNNNYKGN